MTTITLKNLIRKYDLKSKSLEQLEKIIGDSDRNCMSFEEYSFLRGETFIDKAKILFNTLSKKYEN